jgi:hypothetical protein
MSCKFNSLNDVSHRFRFHHREWEVVWRALAQVSCELFWSSHQLSNLILLQGCAGFTLLGRSAALVCAKEKTLAKARRLEVQFVAAVIL